MQSLHTKDDVFARFGHPDIQRMADSTEIWIYNHDVSGKNPQPGVKNRTAHDTSGMAADGPQNVFINFMFDRTGNIVGYKSNGIDLSYVKKVSAGTNILNVLGATAIIVVVVAIDAYTNGDISF